MQDEEYFLVYHELDQSSIEVSLDVIDLIDQFTIPIIPHVSPEDLTTLKTLTNIHFLHDTAYEESECHKIMNYWLLKYDKELKEINYKGLKVIYAARKNEPTSEILIEILKLFEEIGNELFVFNKTIYILFLIPDEYEKLQFEFNIPKDISAFVDSKTLLVIDYQSYFDKNNSMSFYPTIRHEAVHILLGQYGYYLPFWIEEAICEYYSKKFILEYLSNNLKGSELISFLSIDAENVTYISQLSFFNKIQHAFYMQAVSFFDFILTKVSLDCIWEIIRKSSIRRNFFSLLQSKYGLTLSELQTEWESSIR